MAYKNQVIITSVEHKGLKRFLETNQPKGLPADYVPKIRRIITALVLAETMDTLTVIPGWRLHQLTGQRLGVWTITITGNLRLTFKITNDEISELNLEDYH